MEIRNPRLKYIWETATDTSDLKNNREIAEFHYYNPNGLYARKKNNDDVRKLANKRRVNTIALSVALQLLEEHTETQEATITEATA